MLTFKVSEEFKKVCPEFKGVAIYGRVNNSPFNQQLWEKIDQFTVEYRKKYTIESIKEMYHIQATRQAYKRCGKDPSRYRPAAEALCRRILKNVPLYQIDTLVDLINLVSIATGYSIGGFDVDRIEGEVITLGIGKTAEPYEGIGRGELNIEGLPVYRDMQGGIGTPTSDNERTKITLETTRLLTIINGYGGVIELPEAVDFMQSLLREFAGLDEQEISYF